MSTKVVHRRRTNHSLIQPCRVCSSVVPRRKDYQPKICEACQKFFRRNYLRRSTLQCPLTLVASSVKCAFNSRTRSTCKRCRFDKCVAVGMKYNDGKVTQQRQQPTPTPMPTSAAAAAAALPNVVESCSHNGRLVLGSSYGDVMQAVFTSANFRYEDVYPSLRFDSFFVTGAEAKKSTKKEMVRAEVPVNVSAIFTANLPATSSQSSSAAQLFHQSYYNAVMPAATCRSSTSSLYFDKFRSSTSSLYLVDEGESSSPSPQSSSSNSNNVTWHQGNWRQQLDGSTNIDYYNSNETFFDAAPVTLSENERFYYQQYY